ncbi:MAG: riboflavin synthase [Bdellovibrionales bacterium]
MFTGIIQTIGIISSLDPSRDWTLRIAADEDVLCDVAIGASIACNGVCLTVVSQEAGSFTAQMSQETLSLTTAKSWHAGMRINLERALLAGQELGGHLVSGHVDGVAKIVSVVAENDSRRVAFEAPAAFAAFLAVKGSVAVDGVSLTINSSQGGRFGVNLVPHTLSATTLGERKAGDEVNFEVDTIVRYVAHRLGCESQEAAQ